MKCRPALLPRAVTKRPSKRRRSTCSRKPSSPAGARCVRVVRPVMRLPPRPDSRCSTSPASRLTTSRMDSDLNRLKEPTLASRRTMRPGCPSCDAFAATSGFALLDIARFVTYYEQDGLAEAREFYHALPSSARNAAGVDLAALRDRCAFRIDYPEIVKRAQRNFA